jgi:glycosyltransferase involved in cell wall biosynthesis
MNLFTDKNYVIVSNWAYPFGGGEEYLYTTMEWAKKLGMKTYWICFCTANNKIYEDFSITEYEYGTMIKLQGGLNKDVLRDWLFMLKPDIVHHQGGMRNIIYKVCKKLRIEFMSGFHFWTGGILLDPVHKNINILENWESHKVDPLLEKLVNAAHCNLYCASQFVSDCIKKVSGISIEDIIYPSSSVRDNYIETTASKNKYVTMVNIHKHKGGNLFLYLIENCPDVSFLGIKTEYGSEELDAKIKEVVDLRNATDGLAHCLLINRVSNMKEIYSQTRILLASSLVDETFCKVVNEAMLNSIPIITTGQGNIKYLVGNSTPIIPIDDQEGWLLKVREMYFDNNLLDKISEDIKVQYGLFSEDKAISLFNNYVENVLIKSKEMNVMILSPWCDQGLGIQSKNYANIFKNSNYNIFIFAIKPYNGKTSIELQKNPDEWDLENVTIYYSGNDREHITDDEIINFTEKYNIGKCLLPETCWFRVFEIAQLFRKLNVKCYAIPNIEIVRKDEIFKHRYFYKILCNNNLCKDMFEKYGINNTKYIGYGIDTEEEEECEENCANEVDDCINFLFIGGMNAFSRKHILEICEGFSLAYAEYNNIKLTCTIQKTNNLEIIDKNRIDAYNECEFINLIQRPLTYLEILGLYRKSDVSIQVSKHEGLGLGFYEALSLGKPIITLDTAPHNEIVIEGTNGWIIPCYYKPMTDNNDALFESAYFDPIVLKDKIIEIIKNQSHKTIINSLKHDYKTRLNVSQFKKRLFSAIN